MLIHQQYIRNIMRGIDDGELTIKQQEAVNRAEKELDRLQEKIMRLQRFYKLGLLDPDIRKTLFD